jgi:hypothetical protein
MPIIGMSLNAIQGKKEAKQMNQEIKVNSTPVIVEVKEVDVANVNKKAISIKFDFMTKYEPDFGQITIKGTLMYLAEKNKPVLDEWDKSKNLPEDVSLEVYNYIFRRCLLKASIIAEDLQLPVPMPMPKISPKPEGK